MRDAFKAESFGVGIGLLLWAEGSSCCSHIITECWISSFNSRTSVRLLCVAPQGSSLIVEVWRMLHSVAGQIEYTSHLGRSLQDLARLHTELTHQGPTKGGDLHSGSQVALGASRLSVSRDGGSSARLSTQESVLPDTSVDTKQLEKLVSIASCQCLGALDLSKISYLIILINCDMVNTYTIM